MYQATKIEALGDGWFAVEIETPSGHVSRYKHWAQSEDEMKVRVNGTVSRLNNDYMQMSAATKAGWMRQRDEGRNPVYSVQGQKNRDAKREAYKSKIRVHLAERKAAKEAGRL